MDTQPYEVPPPDVPDSLAAEAGSALASRYQILGEVARGNMGVVYRGRHKVLNRDVAIKVILDGRSAERFVREGQVMAKVRSPHVVAVHDFDVLPSGLPVLVMEWVEGIDLHRAIQTAGGKLDEERTLPWMRHVCVGMQAAAAQGIIHRDLKPSNIMIGPEGEARVADFGLARLAQPGAEASLTGDGKAGKGIMGTPLYMAPEQALDPRGVDTRADIYSFGATFYHALCGLPPFDGETYFMVLFKHKTEPLIAPKSRRTDLSDRIGGLLERCLAKSPNDRFQGFDQILKYLEPTQPAQNPWEDTDDPGLVPILERYRSRRQDYLKPGPSAELEVYPFPSGRRLRIVRGSLVHETADAIVSSDDEYLSMGGGVSQAILWAAGPEIEKEAWRYVPVRPGRAIVTSGGRLKARFIFHGVVMGMTRDKPLRASRDLITEILTSCFYHADSLHVKSLALPLLGTGSGGFSAEVCLDTMFRYLAHKLLRGVTSVQTATIVLLASDRK